MSKRSQICPGMPFSAVEMYRAVREHIQMQTQAESLSMCLIEYPVLGNLDALVINEQGERFGQGSVICSIWRSLLQIYCSVA